MPVEPPPAVLAELKRRELVPVDCIPIDGGYSGRTPHHNVSDDERIVEWEEPLPGTERFSGFDVGQVGRHNNVNINDHVGCMVEMHRRDGVDWSIVRVVHSQPYGPSDRVSRLRMQEPRFRELNIRLDVVDDPCLSWYAPGSSTLCIMRHMSPLLFDAFRKTFRYWLVVHTRQSGWRRKWTLRDGILPANFEPPDELFFDIMWCADKNSVRLGLDATGVEVYKSRFFFQHTASPETFRFLWSAFRFWCSWRPLLRCCIFVARLKCMRRDRMDHMPPHGRIFLEACRTPMGVV